MRKGDTVVMQKDESLVLKRPRFGGMNAYITLNLNGSVDVGEIQYGNPSETQKKLRIYSKSQVDRILEQRGLSNVVYGLAMSA